MYRLVSQENNLFTLVRQESTDIHLPFSSFKEEKIRAYPLLTGIRTLSVEFIFYPEPAEKDEKGKDGAVGKKEKSKKREEAKTTTWSSDKRFENKEPIIPVFVLFKGIITDDVQRRDYDFEWLLEVSAFDGFLTEMEVFEKKKKEDLKAQSEKEKKIDEQKLPPSKPVMNGVKNTMPLKSPVKTSGARR